MDSANKQNKAELEALVSRASQAVRDEQLDAASVNRAALRVWTRLAEGATVSSSAGDAVAGAGPLATCADFEALMPAALRGEVAASRLLLLTDHTRECLRCRKTWQQMRNQLDPMQVSAGGGLYAATPLRARWLPRHQHGVRWAVAALVLLTAGWVTYSLVDRLLPVWGAWHATVLAASGDVYRVQGANGTPLKAGEKLGSGALLRTAKNGHVLLRLEDGSRVEVKDRSELSLTERASGTTLNLDRGNLIVQAAKQRAGRHLFVATGDALVSVVGTVFAVDSGVKGSRVAVLEGAVRVERAGEDRVLHPGDELSTASSLTPGALADEFSWSQDAPRYLSRLAAIVSLEAAVKQVPLPGARTDTRLLDLMPAGTVFYAGLPNLSASLSDSYAVVQQQIQQNPALQAWWGETGHGGGHNAEMDAAMQRLRTLGGYLGDEVAVGANLDATGRPLGPLVLTTLKDGSGLRNYVESQAGAAGHGPKPEFIDNPLALPPDTASLTPAPPHTLYLWEHGDLLAASPRLAVLQQFALGLQVPGSGFVHSPLHDRIAEVYRQGTGVVVAADLATIVPRLAQAKPAAARQDAVLDKLGFFRLKYLVADQKIAGGQTNSQAQLTFTDTRSGIASWLASPAPMGALDYVTQDASAVADFVVKQPSQMLDDLLGIIAAGSPKALDHLQQFQTEHGIDLRQDLAAPLGGEVAFALDGPVLPTPAWKLVMEVNDPVSLQRGLETLVTQLNGVAAAAKRPTLSWQQAVDNGRTFYTLRTSNNGPETSYTYDNGYLIAGPNRAIVERALQAKDAGYTLRHSPRFRGVLPQDGHTDFSALLYHDLGPVLQSLPAIGTTEQMQALKTLAAQPPTLAYAYAEPQAITFAVNTQQGFFGLSPATLLGLPSPLLLQRHLFQHHHEAGRNRDSH
ncbi:MAG: FecR domain-containing protein [Terriglobales bacterium]